MELHSGSFLRLRNFFFKKIEIEHLCNNVTLEFNVTTVKELKKTSLCNVSTLGLNVVKLANHILEISREHRDVGPNVAMLPCVYELARTHCFLTIETLAF